MLSKVDFKPQPYCFLSKKNQWVSNKFIYICTPNGTKNPLILSQHVPEKAVILIKYADTSWRANAKYVSDIIFIFFFFFMSLYFESNFTAVRSQWFNQQYPNIFLVKCLAQKRQTAIIKTNEIPVFSRIYPFLLPQRLIVRTYTETIYHGWADCMNYKLIV